MPASPFPVPLGRPTVLRAFLVVSLTPCRRSRGLATATVVRLLGDAVRQLVRAVGPQARVKPVVASAPPSSLVEVHSSIELGQYYKILVSYYS